MTANTNISAYILCGGKSSRMRTEKGLVNYLNKPFIQWVIEAVKPITKSIFLVTDNQNYRDFGFPLVLDIYKNPFLTYGFQLFIFATSSSVTIVSELFSQELEI